MYEIADKLFPTQVWMAYDHIEGLHRKTPLIKFGTIRQNGYEVNLYVKMDTLNPGGSFKDRGSEYFVFLAINQGRVKEGDRIVTASAGNHAKGVAKSAQQHGLSSIIYMSSQTPVQKVEGTRKLGGIVEFVDGDYHKAAEEAQRFSEKNGVLYVPAYEHEDVIIGQSTVATEAMIQLHNIGIRPDFFVSPYGGGGLANGIGFALKYFDREGMFSKDGQRNRTFNFAVQAENYNTMYRSFKAGRLLTYVSRGNTIADGIKVANASQQMLELSTRHIDGMFDVNEEQIRSAIRTVYRSEFIIGIQQLPPEELRRKHGFHTRHSAGIPNMNVIEGAAAAAFALAFADNLLPYDEIARQIHPRKQINGVIIASGNNIEKKLLDEILKPAGYNIGMNIGRVAGAGFPGHVHIHVVPRWRGDVNFMPVVGNTKIISQSLVALHGALHRASQPHRHPSKKRK